MVREFSPTNYAPGTFAFEFELLGNGFNLLPDDVVGVPMSDNGNPSYYRYDNSAVNVMNVIERSNNRIVMRAAESSPHGRITSIGMLLSNDRSTVYWINDTRPIP